MYIHSHVSESVSLLSSTAHLYNRFVDPIEILVTFESNIMVNHNHSWGCVLYVDSEMEDGSKALNLSRYFE